MAEAWRDAAACRGMDTRIFYSSHTQQRALAVCRKCWVAVDCLKYAMGFEGFATRDIHGVWGGATQSQRAELAARIRKAREGRANRSPAD